MTSTRPDEGFLAGLVAELVEIGRSAADGTAAEQPDGTAGGEHRVLSGRLDGVVVRVGDVVVKAHAAGAEAAALEVRLRIAADPRLRGVMLPPLPVAPASATKGGFLTRLRSGRLVTVWPAGEPVNPEDPDAAPWEQAATLLARLHTTPAAPPAGLPGAPGVLPAMGGPGRVARALARLRAVHENGTPMGRAEVFRASAGLPAWALGETGCESRTARTDRGVVLVHGDWHFGQMVRTVVAGPDTDWHLIDVDDLGTGDPAWDLARPAAWYAAGLLEPQVWQRFMTAYRDSGGCAVPAEGDVWPALDVPARALTVQSAALGIAAAVRDGRPLDEAEEALIDACGRISRIHPPPGER